MSLADIVVASGRKRKSPAHRARRNRIAYSWP
jgi:hypothetical protein